LSAPSADYYPTYADAAKTLQGESNTKFAQVWVEESAHISARFLIPARLPYILYAKDGVCMFIFIFLLLLTFDVQHQLSYPLSKYSFLLI
jgi:hypothetical protein